MAANPKHPIHEITEIYEATRTKADLSRSSVVSFDKPVTFCANPL